jgi:site-specific DNA recombinase
MRAAIYARVSTERQGRQQTIDSQLALLREWASGHRHELAPQHVFTDEGYTGSRLDRPGLDALRDAVQGGDVEVVAVLTPDRLTRKYAYQVLLLEEFRKAGCEVVFVQRPLSDDPHDQLLLQIQGAVAEYERAVLGERFRRGKLQKARAGHWIGGRAPYGYRYVRKTDATPGHLAIDEAEAEVVRMLYHWFVEERLTIRQVLRRLSLGPWRPRSGRRRWSSAVVHRILFDSLYCGTAYVNRYRFAPPKRPRRRRPGCADNTCRRPRPAEEWIAIPVPAIIDPECHRRAQEQLRRNARLSFRHNTRHDYLLRCLLSCRTCGLAMFGTTYRATARQPQRRYYKCHGKDCLHSGRDEPCPQRLAKARELEAAVWEHLKRLLGDPEALLEQFQKAAQEARGAGDLDQERARRLEGQLRRLDREEQRLIDAYQEGVITLEELGQRRQKARQQREAVSARQKEQERQLQEAEKARALLLDLRSFCGRVCARLDAVTFAERQQLMQLLIERVIVGEDTLEIRHVIPLRRPPADAEPKPIPPPDAEDGLRSDGVHHAALPRRLREALADRFHQPRALVRHHQPHAAKAARLQVPQERPPALGVLLAALRHPRDLAVPVAADPDRHQHRHVLDLAAPGALQPDAVEVDVGVLPLDGAVAPRLDLAVDLLVQLADGAGRDLGPPQRLGDVLHPAHAHAGQVHLDQRLLDARLPPPVALDDLRLERQLAQARHRQRHLAGLGLELALVAAGPRVGAVGAALVAPGVAQGVGLGVEQGVEGLLDGGAHDLIDVALDLAFVDADHLAEAVRLHVVVYTGHHSLLVGQGSWSRNRIPISPEAAHQLVRNYSDVIKLLEYGRESPGELCCARAPLFFPKFGAKTPQANTNSAADRRPGRSLRGSNRSGPPAAESGRSAPE